MLLLHTIAVSCQACTTPGSLNHSNISYNRNTTYILNGYTVQCEGIVTTWEFCYHMNSSVPSATFYPGIWNKTGKVFYTHIQSNTVTFTPNGTNINSCENYTIPEAERFTVPSGSVVGLYSNFNVQLLRTNDTNQQMPTYQFDGNQSDVTINGNTKKAGYNVAIRVHVGKLYYFTDLYTCVCIKPNVETTLFNEKSINKGNRECIYGQSLLQQEFGLSNYSSACRKLAKL